MVRMVEMFYRNLSRTAGTIIYTCTLLYTCEIIYLCMRAQYARNHKKPPLPSPPSPPHL